MNELKQLAKELRDRAARPDFVAPSVLKDVAERIEAVTKRNRLRNCDVGTHSELSDRYYKFCVSHRNKGKGCEDCPAFTRRCGFKWMLMPYESEEAK